MPSLAAHIQECMDNIGRKDLPWCKICVKVELDRGQELCPRCKVLKITIEDNLELSLIVINRLLEENKYRDIKQRLLRGGFK